MPNENCLEGMQCPRCGSCEPFGIECEGVFEMWDDGSGNHGDLDWNEDSYCECLGCHHHGEVKDFKRSETV